MKKLPVYLYILSAFVCCLCGCEKEVIDSQNFVQQKILGSWPLKYQVRTVYTGDMMGTPDTLARYNPIDTLVFTADGMATKRNKTVISSVPYSIDATGQNITFSSTPAVTLQITFIRNSSIGFGTATLSNVNGKQVRTVIDDHYVKN